MSDQPSTEVLNKPSLVRVIAERLFGQRESGLFLLIALILVVLSTVRPDTFFTSNNLLNILKQVSLITIVAVGQTLILTIGGPDLSVGYNMGLAGVMLAYFIQQGMDPTTAVLLGILLSVMVGVSNGVLVTQLALPPFIVTLGVAKIALGVMYVITRGYPIPTRTPFIVWLGNGYIGPIPVPAIIMFVVVGIGAYLLQRTVLGNRIKAIGGNEQAARLSGIKVRQTKILVFAITGLLCGIAGVIMVGRVNSGSPNAGLGFDLDSIAASIIGGTALAGGEGTVIGTLLGALLLGIIANGLVLMNVSMYWQTIVSGAIIVAVVGIDSMAHKS